MSGVLATDGTASSVPLARVGQTARYTFAGTAGAGFTLLATTGSTFTGSVAISVYQPSGASIASASIAKSTSTKLDLGLLPASGTYTVVVTPAGVDTGTVSIAVIPYATGVLQVGDPAQTIVLATGQNGRYSFTGNAGDIVSLGLSGATTTPSGGVVAVTVWKPNGASFSDTYNWGSSAGSLRLGALPLTGTYVLTLQPGGTAAASVTVLLSAPLTGTLATDGTTTQFSSSRIGQTGQYTFSGTAGQGFTIQATTGATFTSPVSIAVSQPSGAAIATGSVAKSTSAKLDLGLLPASGTYTVVVTPSGSDTGTVDLRLVPEDTGALVVGGTAKSISLGAAQNGRYTFSGTTGDLRSLVCSSLSITPSGSSLTVAVLNPDGTSLASNSVSSALTWQVPQLTATGTYTVTLKPTGTAAATLNLQLISR